MRCSNGCVEAVFRQSGNAATAMDDRASLWILYLITQKVHTLLKDALRVEATTPLDKETRVCCSQLCSDVDLFH